MDLLCRRRVLDELHQVVLIHHLARRHREVAPHHEGALVGHAHPEAAAAGLQVLQQVVQSVDQISPAAGDRLAQHEGVGGGEVTRRQRVDHLLGSELELGASTLVEVLGIRHQVDPRSSRQQVGLLDQVEDRVLVPRCVVEAAIVARGRHHRCHVLAEHLLHRVLGKADIVPPQTELGLGEWNGIGPETGRELQQRLAQSQRIRDLHAVAPLSVAAAAGQQAKTAAGQAFGRMHEFVGCQRLSRGIPPNGDRAGPRRSLVLCHAAVHHRRNSRPISNRWPSANRLARPGCRIRARSADRAQGGRLDPGVRRSLRSPPCCDPTRVLSCHCLLPQRARSSTIGR